MKKQMPDFSSEQEEATWLYEHRNELEAYMDPMTNEEIVEAKAQLAKLKSSKRQQ